MSDAFTIGVIGHVDHGKTALVRALTGIETDRLREERERGLSIVLGFAYLDGAQGVVDLIDVPGHEAFIRAMIAGATALDAVLLCVAANESVMPQTVEHLNIAKLLGVGRGAIVITKTDLVDAETLELVREELAEFVAGTFLEGVVPVEASVESDTGIASVRAAIEGLAADEVEREAGGSFFLPLDRVFTMRGFGVVGTGTLRGGRLVTGDAVEIMPGQGEATVRALQNHNEAVDEALPGQRVAVNLRNVDRDEIARGDVLAAPGSLEPVRRIDAELSLLDDGRELRNGTTVRLLTGTTEAMARLRLLGQRRLEPGETAIAQFELDREIATRATEPFLIRSVSPMLTIGGGKVLAVNPKRHRRYDADVTRRLATEASGDLEQILMGRLAEAGAPGLTVADLAAQMSVERRRIDEAIGALDVAVINDALLVSQAAYDALLAAIVDKLENRHAAEPLKPGIDVGSLGSELGLAAESDVLRHAIRRLVEDGTVRFAQDHLSMTGFDPFAGLSDAAQGLVGRVEKQFLDYGLEVPSPDSVVGSGPNGQTVLTLLLDAGRLVRLRTYDRKSQMIMHADTVMAARQAIERKFPYPEPFALKDIRDLLGSTRKYIVPLMEHFDATGATVRSGDLRRLRQS